MSELLDMIGFAIALFAGAYVTLFHTQLWWLGLVMGGFAVLLSWGVTNRIVGGTY